MYLSVWQTRVYVCVNVAGGCVCVGKARLCVYVSVAGDLYLGNTHSVICFKMGMVFKRGATIKGKIINFK